MRENKLIKRIHNLDNGDGLVVDIFNSYIKISHVDNFAFNDETFIEVKEIKDFVKKINKIKTIKDFLPSFSIDNFEEQDGFTMDYFKNYLRISYFVGFHWHGDIEINYKDILI